MNKMLYADKLKRLDLLACANNNDVRNITLAIHRNHSFEMISSVINAFLYESGLGADFIYSDYDDSFNFKAIEADLHILWIDLERYKITSVSDFVRERVAALRAMVSQPILVIYTGHENIDSCADLTDCYFLSTDVLLKDMSYEIYDLSKEVLFGTKLSSAACLELARILGMLYIPGILKPSLKAIVVDLDNTLYQGVLGEDGCNALVANNELQTRLKELKDSGFFLCIASKNEEEDVRQMFESRTDFILRWDDFTTCQINWDSKDINLLKMAARLNIGTDAMLFIDDNPAEIQNVQSTGVKTILAGDDINTVMKYYPGLLKLKKSEEDTIRAKDIQANQERMALAQSLTPAQYFEKLGIKLEYHVNNKDQIPRVAELLGKTNQFILDYLRSNETQVNEYMSDDNKCVITIRMSDNLSDSGVIAILLAHKNNGLFLDELTVSCRALGRNLENVMLPYMFQVAADVLTTDKKICISYKEGPRNGPALKWLANLTEQKLSKEGFVMYKIPTNIDLTGLDVEVCK